MTTSLRHAFMVLLLSAALGLPAALAQQGRQWTDPPGRAGAPPSGADTRGPSDAPATRAEGQARSGQAKPDAAGKPGRREAGRRMAARAKARPAAGAMRRMAAVRSAALHRRQRVARVDRDRFAARSSARAALRRTPASDRVGAIGKPQGSKTLRTRLATPGIVRSRPGDDPGPVKLFDPDTSGFDWCE